MTKMAFSEGVSINHLNLLILGCCKFRINDSKCFYFEPEQTEIEIIILYHFKMTNVVVFGDGRWWMAENI